MHPNVTDHSNQVGLHRIAGGGCEESGKTRPSFDLREFIIYLINQVNQTRGNLVYKEFMVPQIIDNLGRLFRMPRSSQSVGSQGYPRLQISGR